MQWNTERILIRRFVEQDLEGFYAYRNDEAVARYQGWEFPYPREKAVEFIDQMKEVAIARQGDWTQLAMQSRATGELIGDVAVFILREDARQAEIGITLAAAYQGRGLAREASRWLLDYLFKELGLHRVRASCDVENIASIKVLEGLGLRREAHFIENVFTRGRWASEYVYALLGREWLIHA